MNIKYLNRILLNIIYSLSFFFASISCVNSISSTSYDFQDTKHHMRCIDQKIIKPEIINKYAKIGCDKKYKSFMRKFLSCYQPTGVRRLKRYRGDLFPEGNGKLYMSSLSIDNNLGEFLIFMPDKA